MNLIQLKEKTEEKKRLKNLIKKAESELQTEINKLEQLTVQLKKEHADVQRLKDGGLTSMFYSFLGNKVEKLEKERQEYLAAKLKYENCKKEIEEIEIEISKLQKKLLECGFPEKEYKNIMNKKTLKLREKQDEKFLKYEELLEYFFSQKKEVNEAIAAGERALQGLQYAMQYLRKAKNWGTFDMIGGGLLATAAKHSNIDEAKQLIHEVQIWLRKFKRELADINLPETELDVQLDSFSTFADYFFDNLIFDWVVQSKINRSLEGCERTYSQVSRILTRLKSSDTNLTGKYRTAKSDFNNYVENTF